MAVLQLMVILTSLGCLTSTSPIHPCTLVLDFTRPCPQFTACPLLDKTATFLGLSHDVPCYRYSDVSIYERFGPYGFSTTSSQPVTDSEDSEIEYEDRIESSLESDFEDEYNLEASTVSAKKKLLFRHLSNPVSDDDGDEDDDDDFYDSALVNDDTVPLESVNHTPDETFESRRRQQAVIDSLGVGTQLRRPPLQRNPARESSSVALTLYHPDETEFPPLPSHSADRHPLETESDKNEYHSVFEEIFNRQTNVESRMMASPNHHAPLAEVETPPSVGVESVQLNPNSDEDVFVAPPVEVEHPPLIGVERNGVEESDNSLENSRESLDEVHTPDRERAILAAEMEYLQRRLHYKELMNNRLATLAERAETARAATPRSDEAVPTPFEVEVEDESLGSVHREVVTRSSKATNHERFWESPAADHSPSLMSDAGEDRGLSIMGSETVLEETKDGQTTKYTQRTIIIACSSSSSVVRFCFFRVHMHSVFPFTHKRIYARTHALRYVLTVLFFLVRTLTHRSYLAFSLSGSPPPPCHLEKEASLAGDKITGQPVSVPVPRIFCDPKNMAPGH